MSFVAAVLLSGLGALSSSKPVVILAGLGWLATGISVYRLQTDGFVFPSASIDFLGYTKEDRQAGAPLIFMFFAIAAFAVAYSMK